MIHDTLTTNLATLFDAFTSSIMANLRVSLPAEIVSFDPQTQTATVQPCIKQKIVDADGKATSYTLPLLVDCPVQFPCGGNISMTFPIKPGDECLIIFADRCIDFWWQSGGVQESLESRLHDLSDAFVLVGYRSTPKVIENISRDAMQIRTNDGNNLIELHENGTIRLQTTGSINAQCQHATINASQEVTVAAATQLTLQAAQIALEGVIELLGNITGGSASQPINSTLNGGLTVTQDVLSGAISLMNHTHPIPNGGMTGKPQ